MEAFGNFAQVQAALLAVIPRVEIADEEVAGRSAQIVAQVAAARAPVRTGELRASVGENGGEVVAESEHAIFVEYGTRRSKAQPFLRPARDASEPAVRQVAEAIYTAATR